MYVRETETFVSIQLQDLIARFKYELLMPLAEIIKELVSFILKGVDLIDHTSIFLLRTINHYVTLIMCTLS